MALLEVAQKHIFERDAKKLAEILTAIANYTRIDHVLFADVLEYVLMANDVRDPQELVATLTEKAGPYKGEVMTTAEYLRQQGKQEGIQEGIQVGKQKGIQEGKQKGLLEVAKNMLANGFDVKTIKEITGLSFEELSKLNSKH